MSGVWETCDFGGHKEEELVGALKMRVGDGFRRENRMK